MEKGNIHQILVAGAGTMGRQITLHCALHGCEVVLYDVNESTLEEAQTAIEGYAKSLVVAGRFSRDQSRQAISNIAYIMARDDAARSTDLLIEAIPEIPKAKAALFLQFGDLCPEHTIFVTNTSSLKPSKIARATGRPDRFAAFHFHIPVWDARLVDIMPHAETSKETMAALEEFARRIGQIPIVMEKEADGYVFNTMLNGILRSSLHLVASGTATIEDVDRSWMAIMGMPIGPFGIMDRIGIDVVYEIANQSAGIIRFIPRAKRILRLLDSYVSAGKLGEKSGEGFYSYPNPAFQDPNFVAGTQTDSQTS